MAHASVHIFPTNKQWVVYIATANLKTICGQAFACAARSSSSADATCDRTVQFLRPTRKSGPKADPKSSRMQFAFMRIYTAYATSILQVCVRCPGSAPLL